jgi:hypothetical protein
MIASDASHRSAQAADFGRAWSWEDVCAHLQAQPITLALVREIRARGIDRSMHAACGIEGLYLAMSQTWPRNGDVLRVAEDRSSVRLTYLASAKQGGSYSWDYEYPADQVWAAFVRFVVRAHWFADNHPLLAEARA